MEISAVLEKKRLRHSLGISEGVTRPAKGLPRAHPLNHWKMDEKNPTMAVERKV
jgi:hypothetical protein